MAFQWAQVKPPVLKGLALAAGLDHRNAADRLRRRFGAKPTEDFIQEMWPTLRDEWLSRDRPAAKALADALRSRGAGNAAIKLSNHEQRLDYLRSCRISKAVREEALPIFLASTGGSAPAAKKATPSAIKKPAASAAKSAAPKKAAPPKKAAATASTKQKKRPSDRSPEEAIEALRSGLRSMRPQDVPGVLMALFGINSLSASQESDPEQLRRRFVFTFVHVMADSTDVVPPRPAAEAAVALRSEPAHLGTAKKMAEGARAWADQDLMSLLEIFAEALGRSDDPVDSFQATLFAAIAVCAFAAEPPEAEAIMGLAEWSIGVFAQAHPSDEEDDDEDDDEPLATDDEVHELVIETVRSIGTAEGDHLYRVKHALAWFASEAGPTFIEADHPLESRGMVVTPITVSTAVIPRRTLTDRQMAAALSELNRRDGVNSAAHSDGRVLLRSALVSYDAVNGWLPLYLGVSFIASAMGALHLPTELRGEPVAGPEGVRTPPAHYVAEYSGWDVSPEDEEEYAMPTKASIRSVAENMPLETDVKVSGEEVVVRLPGPNQQLENWLGRRRGKSDDHELVISKVTRPPWGAGMKFVFRVPTDGGAAANEALAMRANVDEWSLIPNVNVWGGWSGEAGALRLTMFIPQMLFRGSDQGKLNAVANFIVYGVTRANSIAISYGLA